MDQPIVERRVDPRVGQPAIAEMRAMLRPGVPVVLHNVSAGGVLIEAARPLKPGSRVHVQLTNGNRRFGLAARVIRCAVSSLDQGVQYRGALKFDHRCPELWEQGTLDGYVVPAEAVVISDPRDAGVTPQDAANGGTGQVRSPDQSSPASAMSAASPGSPGSPASPARNVHGIPAPHVSPQRPDDHRRE